MRHLVVVRDLLGELALRRLIRAIVHRETASIKKCRSPRRCLDAEHGEEQIQQCILTSAQEQVRAAHPHLRHWDEEGRDQRLDRPEVALAHVDQAWPRAQQHADVPHAVVQIVEVLLHLA